MNKNLHTIFSPTGCLPDEVLQRYASGEMNPAEKHAVEKHITDCEMCSDAVDGLMLFKHAEKARSLAASVSREALAKTGGSSGANVIRMEPRSSWSVQMRVAAAIAVLMLAAGGYYFINRGTEDLHKNIVAEQAPVPAEELQPASAESAPEIVANSNTTAVSTPGTYTVTLLDSHASVAEVAENAKGGGKKTAPSPSASLTLSSGITKKEKDEISSVIAYNGTSTSLKTDSLSTYQWNFSDSSTIAYNKSQKVEPMFAPAASQPSKAESENYSYEGAAKAKSKADDKVIPLSGAVYNASGDTDTLKRTQESDAKQKDIDGADLAALSEKEKAEELKKKTEESKKIQEKQSAAASTNKSKTSRSRVKSAYGSFPSSKSAPKEKSLDSYALAKKKYDEKDYKGALKYFEDVLKEKPGHYEALYYSGECYQRTGQPEKAISALTNVLKDEKGVFYDDALWYKALAHLDKKETPAAIELLEKEVKINGRFKTEAEEKLRTLR